MAKAPQKVKEKIKDKPPPPVQDTQASGSTKPESPIQKYEVSGFDKFMECIKEIEEKDKAGNNPIYVFFTGSKLSSGESWCPHCNIAYPEVKRVFEKMVKAGHFVYAEVGDYITWRNPKLPFRTDTNTQLLVIPTLMKWKTPKRLNGSDCGKADLLELLFGDEEES